MKTVLLIITYLVAGITFSNAQSNPVSTNAVDTEMQLAWPDGQVYISAEYDVDKTIYGYGTTNPTTYFNTINWQLTDGGTSEQKSYSLTTTNFDDQYDWTASQWPDGYLNFDVTLPLPAQALYGMTTTYGSADFTPAGSQENIQWQDQAKVTLITGGLPGATSSELYSITVSGVLLNYAYPGFPPEFGVNFSQQQVQVGSLGQLTLSATNQGGQTYGTLWASLPAHTTVPATPRMNGSQYAAINVQAQGYQLVSQCVATTPANRARTTLGVGEQVNLYFSPALQVYYTNIVWNTTAGSLLETQGSSTQWTAPSNAANAMVTATVFGKPVSINFKVVAPNGYAYAQTIGTNHFSVGVSGAGMTNIFWIAPTSVSFYRINIMEVGEDGTNIFGYFSQWTPSQLHHKTADHWSNLSQANQCSDWAASFSNSPPWSVGGYSWNIPARWQVAGSGMTNSMNGWNQVFSIDASGTVTVQKFNHIVTRTINDVITTQ